MPFWRRDDEPEHERLAREAGIELAPPMGEERMPLTPAPQHPLVGALREAGIHGLHRQREWDAIASVLVPDLDLDELEFTALPDGTLLVEDDLPDGALTPLADALEQTLSPPYHARAVRRENGVWAVAANKIEVVEVPEDIEGDTVSLAVQGEDRTLLIDDRPGWGGLPTLEAHAARHYRDFVLHAERLDGQLWAVKVNPL
jgi:hypothetical protein